MELTPRRIMLLVFSVVCCAVLLASLGSLFENLDASQVMVIQSPVSGNLAYYINQGVKWQGFGKVTKYNKRSQFWFSSKSDQGKKEDESIKMRFNDGGHANLSGSISWEVPIDEHSLYLVHTKFGSQKAIEQQLVRTVIEKSVYMSGPIMSSKESYAERRNELLHIVEDQIQNGIYATKTRQEKQKDPITGIEKTVSVVEVVVDKSGKAERSEESPLNEFGIKTSNLSINEVKYEDTVETQIKEQQKMTMQVQLAIADAKEAEQRTLTAEQRGKADAAKATWEQKTLMAKAVTEAEQIKQVAETKAEQELAVSELAAKAAEQKKLADIAIGEGEAKRRTLVMEADGALEKKLEAWVSVNEKYAEAIKEHKGNWVPSVVMGGNGDSKNNAATDLIQLLMVKTASDLGISMDMAVKSK